jgi:hypothetical protein
VKRAFRNGGARAAASLRPRAPGRYNFVDDFNQQANGVLVVR